jgi:hypothetical protein
MSEAEQVYQSCFDLRWHFDPATASEAGVSAQNSRLGEFDAESMRTHLAAFRSLSSALEALEVDDVQEEIDRSALLNAMRSTLFQFEHEKPHTTSPVFWVNHFSRALYALLDRHDTPPDQLAIAALSRLRAVPSFFRAATDTLRDPPPILRDTAESMIDGGELLIGLVAQLCRAQPDLDANEIDTAAAEAEAAMARFGLVLKTELATGEELQGFAIGEEQFNRRLHFEHALTSSAPELWRYGMHLIEEVEADLVRVARTVDATVSWRLLADRLRSESPVAGDPIAACRAAVARARSFVESHDIATLPAAPLDVVPTPDFLRPLIPFAAYSPPGPLSTDRAGRFYVTPRSEESRKGEARSAFELASMSLHEGFPGHHLHLLTSQSLSSPVRQIIWSPVSVEGWALYCEGMMGEQGFYEDPREQFFQLVHLLWRAVRIILDVGLHTRNMSPSAAILFLLEKVPLEPAEALAEVRRYCCTPTYPLSYAVGRRDILALRGDYQRERGSSSLRVFHDELMQYGGLPVSFARWGMGLSE